MPENFFFYIGLSFLTLHEMDAIRCKEWRIFPGLSLLNDPAGYIVFVTDWISWTIIAGAGICGLVDRLL